MNSHNKSWHSALNDCQNHGIAHVLATVVKVSGSAPRDLQTKMVITADKSYDTLGGGGLEFDVIATARELLNKNIACNNSFGNKHQHTSVITKHYPLGAKLGQCCGGSVTVMFECFNLSPPLSLLIFGAGHVANALIKILSELDCQVTWIDNREGIFDKNTVKNIPPHIRTFITDDPTEFIKAYPTPQYVLVMTHDHDLDFKIVKKTIEISTPSFAFIGCIASKTKANRFKQKLDQRGFTEDALSLLHMPIGLPIGGKQPMSVAVSVVAQVLQKFNQS